MASNTVETMRANVREKFLKVREMLDDHDKLSTENEPYKYKYAVIDLLKEIKTDLSSILNTTDRTDDDIIMFAVVTLNIGLLHAETEEFKAAEEEFMKCLNILKGKELEPEAVLAVLSSLNQLGIVWCSWNEPIKAKVFLERAEQIYNDFNKEQDPINMALNFGIEDKEGLSAKEVLEKLHTLTLYYLAQVYGLLKDHCKSAIYCHVTLQRQLSHNEKTHDLDYVDWALNVATLSQYFMEHEKISQARHHLAAASYILEKYKSMLEKKGQPEESEALAAEWEEYKHRSADIARCWAKYGILLLNLSKQRLLQKTEIEDCEESETQDNQKSESKKDLEKCLENLKFESLEKDIEPIVNQVTDKYLLDFNDARPVFLNAQKWLEQAKEYYTLENHASDYVQIAQDMSHAYKYLSFFEENEDRQAKMHKRRIDILENVIKELNPQYYKASCRQIWIELGETYSDILDIKLDRLRTSDEKPSAHSLAKINHLARSAIKNFQHFLDSIERNTSSDGTVKFSEDVMQPALCAYFYLGRLYSKIITSDKTMQLENTQNSINAYKFVIDYCEKDPKAAEVTKTELNLCKELANLLPLKIDRLKQELMN